MVVGRSGAAGGGVVLVDDPVHVVVGVLVGPVSGQGTGFRAIGAAELFALEVLHVRIVLNGCGAIGHVPQQDVVDGHVAADATLRGAEDAETHRLVEVVVQLHHGPQPVVALVPAQGPDLGPGFAVVGADLQGHGSHAAAVHAVPEVQFGVFQVHQVEAGRVENGRRVIAAAGLGVEVVAAGRAGIVVVGRSGAAAGSVVLVDDPVHVVAGVGIEPVSGEGAGVVAVGRAFLLVLEVFHIRITDDGRLAARLRHRPPLPATDDEQDEKRDPGRVQGVACGSFSHGGPSGRVKTGDAAV